MSYDNPNREKFSVHFDAGNLGNGGWTFSGPKGKSGRLYDYGIEGVTEVFTTGASVSVGTNASAAVYGAALSLDGVAVGSGKTSARSLNDPTSSEFGALMVNQNIPADTSVKLTFVDDAASGICEAFVTIDWDD
jgi:hypothetical protein